ncbi:MAG: trypsin-like serine protease [Planctomycetes bacterium]|nr:trypsin-like serine protease [Planctomycetota bacterium]
MCLVTFLATSATSAQEAPPPAAPEKPETTNAPASATQLDTGQPVEVTVLGGAQVVGTLLRQNNAGLVIDLGFDALHIPADQALDVRPLEADDENDAETDEAGIYRTGRLEPASIPKLVERFGDAVVMVKTPAGLGSGFVISDQKHLITNYHVIENQTRVSVTVFQKTDRGYRKHEFHQVRIVAIQPLRDIALLRVVDEKAADWTPEPVVIAEGGGPAVGDLIFAIGNPLGLERSVTQGIVSSTTRTVGHLRMLQTDASINPGNSGGPMFNARGEVVGIVCAGATMFDGLAFGIPANDLLDFLKNRDAFLYDPSQPMNGITYLEPPYVAPDAEE